MRCEVTNRRKTKLVISGATGELEWIDLRRGPTRSSRSITRMRSVFARRLLIKLLTGSLVVAAIEQQHTEPASNRNRRIEKKKQLMKLLSKLATKTKGLVGAKFAGFCVGGSV